MKKATLVLIVLAVAVLRRSNAENIKGAISLNSGTFDKVVNKYKAVLVKFDKVHPYGDKQNTFKALADDCSSQPELIIADVLITDYGHRDNDDLRERFNIKKEDYPHYKLFVKDRQEPVDFKGNPEKTEELKEFIIAETGLWLGLPACIEEFDNLARGYFTAPSLEDRKSVVETARKRAEAIKEEPKRSRALYYAKTLEKLAEKGDNYLADETERVKKLLDGKLSEHKKSQLKERASILSSFQLRQKDEL